MSRAHEMAPDDVKKPKYPTPKSGVPCCDLTCQYASWPEDSALDGSGSCRTFQAIYCVRKKRSVYKNAPCDDKEKRSGSPSPAKRPPGKPR